MQVISGLSHITLIVKDLEKTAALYKRIFEAQEIYSSAEHTFSLAREKFFLVGGLWLYLMEGEPLPQRTYNHIAFKVEENALEDFIDRIHSSGVEIKPERPRVAGEGRSIYFYDYDNHLFELHTGTLEERLARYAREE